MNNDVNKTLVDLAADLTRSYASNGQLSASEVATYFHETLAGLQGTAMQSPDVVDTTEGNCVSPANMEEEPAVESSNDPNTVSEDLLPAVPVERSVNPDYIVCLEDGKRFKMLKRHLRNSYGMTPEEYRRKWGLPEDYPMVAPNYSSWKSKYAKATGFGNRKTTQTYLRAISA